MKLRNQNLILTFLYPFVSPINFAMDWYGEGWDVAVGIEKKNFKNLFQTWRNVRNWW